MDCPKCNEHFAAADGAALTYTQASFAVLKDWQMWLFAVVITFIAGATGGALNLPSGFFFGGSGALIGLVYALRSRTVKKCPKCGAVFQSAPFFGRGGGKPSAD